MNEYTDFLFFFAPREENPYFIEYMAEVEASVRNI